MQKTQFFSRLYDQYFIISFIAGTVIGGRKQISSYLVHNIFKAVHAKE